MKLISNKITNFKSKMNMICMELNVINIYTWLNIYIFALMHIAIHTKKVLLKLHSAFLYIQFEILIKLFTFKTKIPTSNRLQS